MDRAVGKLVGTGGSAVSSTSGQLPTSAGIEKDQVVEERISGTIFSIA